MFVGCIWWMRIWYQPVHPVNLEWSVHTDLKRMWKRLIPLKGPTFPVVDPGFPRSGGANPPGGANLRFHQIFLKTGRNWKNLDGGGECALAPLRSDNSLRNRWWIQDFPEKVGCGANLWFCIKNLLFGNILAEKPHDNEKKWGGGRGRVPNAPTPMISCFTNFFWKKRKNKQIFICRATHLRQRKFTNLQLNSRLMSKELNFFESLLWQMRSINLIDWTQTKKIRFRFRNQPMWIDPKFAESGLHWIRNERSW